MSDVTIVDVKTGRVTVREFTDAEIAAREAAASSPEIIEHVLSEREVARQAALSKLSALGFTAEEIAAL